MPRETEKQRIGNIGEELACMFLVKQGFTIIERNYKKKWGEIDIMAKKDKILHFIEVKTVTICSDNSDVSVVSHETYIKEKIDVTHETFISRLLRFFHIKSEKKWHIEVTHETTEIGTPYKTSATIEEYLPEENVHRWKKQRIKRAIQIYIAEKHINDNQEWQIDIMAVLLDFPAKKAIIRVTDDVVLDV